MDGGKRTVDECSEFLRARGWLVKETLVNDPNQPAHCQIDCASGNKSFTILAPLRSDAWNQAIRAVMGVTDR